MESDKKVDDSSINDFTKDSHQKYYFLVYNDNTHINYLEQLINSVKKYGKEFEIIIFNKNDIDNDFFYKNINILNCSRGGGYWLWKPYIINNILNKINDNDIIFYLDSKYYFTEEFSDLYKEYMINNDILIWKNKPNEPTYFLKRLCKMDVILKYNMYDKFLIENVEECWAGAMIIKKNINTINYIHEWLNMCCIYEDITDFPSKSKNDDTFIEHRHDQSLFGIIVHKYNIKMSFFEKKYLQNCRNPY
jgi:hypothetical protein